MEITLFCKIEFCIFFFVMRTKRSIKDSLKEYLNWCVGRLLLGGSRNDTVRDMVDAISDEIASGGGVVSQDQLDQTVKDVTKAYGIADQTVLTSAESYTDQKIADVVDGSPEALDTLYELAKALGDDSNFATTVMDQIGQKLPTTTFENFIDNKAWTKDNLTKLSQLINNINSIKAGTRVGSMDLNLASMSSYLRYDLFDANTTGTKPGNLTTGFLLTFSWDNGGWGVQIATSYGNIDGAIFLRTIKASESDKIWGPWVSLYNTANFNPDSKFPYLGMGGVNDNSNEIGAGYSGSSAGGNFNGPFIKFGQTSNYMTELYNRHDQDVFQIRRMVNGEWQPFVSLWHSGNLGNATTSKAGLMSAADKTKLDGLSGGSLRGESPTYIFPGDPSKLSKVDSLTTITSILGTASDFLDAFNNGRVFISKTVTFSGVQVPSDIIYSLLKSEDPDTPTVFHIIMSIVIWGHYIEITVDFENNEYQAISNTINGIIGVNTTGTTN